MDSTSRIVANVNFTSSTLTATNDGYGHGTHVAGLAAGSAGNNSGAYRGAAPNANIISVKVLSDSGTGQTSWLLNGLNWVLQNKTAYNIKVVNLSLGTTGGRQLYERSGVSQGQRTRKRGYRRDRGGRQPRQNQYRDRKSTDASIRRATAPTPSRLAPATASEPFRMRRFDRQLQLARPDTQLLHERQRREGL